MEEGRREVMDLFVSYAQNYEDVYLWRALKHIERGCYIDVGAYDPTNDSVTRAFYERGWRGINLEPTKACFNRFCEARPEDMNLNMAAGSAEGSITLYEVTGTGMSTAVYENALRAQQRGLLFETIDVRATTLNRIWEEFSPAEVHFLKIDVEGGEESVLRGLDLSNHRPWIIVIESVIPNSSEENFASWESILLNSNYSFVLFDGLNRYYLAKEHVDLSSKLSLPPNFFDYFVRASEVDARREAQDLLLARQALERNVEDFKRDNELLHATLNAIHATLNAIYESRSWRYTAPLRAAESVLVRVMRASLRAADNILKNSRRVVQGVGQRLLESSALRQVGKRLLPWHIRCRIRRFLTASQRQKMVRLTANWRNGGLVQSENRNEGSPRMFSITECRQAIDVAELKARIHRQMECHKAAE
jgi:FkbM family methyltransferase